MMARFVVLVFGSMWNLKRLCMDVDQSPLKRILIALYCFYQSENQSCIEWNATFASVPCLPHGLKGIFVSGGAKIGRNCIIFQQVTIGSNALLDSKGYGAPIIGDNCYIGAGAKVIGKVRVGHNVRIGANAVVHRDVPDNSVVLSGEQKIITRDAPLDNRYCSWSPQVGYLYYDNEQWIPVRNDTTGGL